ncbi:hypothetical protein STANM309S_02799 [Streptomyces tanashiensis]
MPRPPRLAAPPATPPERQAVATHEARLRRHPRGRRSRTGRPARLRAARGGRRGHPAWTPPAGRGRRLVETLPGRWSPYALRMTEGGEPGAIEAVKEGRAGVQDEGSQLVAIALANAPLEGSDTRWLDGCAGPGGKAALLGALAAERGAFLLASEKQQHRARLVESRALAGNPGPYQVITADGTRLPAPRLLRPDPHGRAVLGPRSPPPPPRGTLAPPPRGPRRLRPAAARPAHRGAERRARRRRRRLRDLLAASRRDPGGRRRRPEEGRRRRG